MAGFLGGIFQGRQAFVQGKENFVNKAIDMAKDGLSTAEKTELKDEFKTWGSAHQRDISTQLSSRGFEELADFLKAK